jgi:hypothetical protein
VQRLSNVEFQSVRLLTPANATGLIGDHFDEDPVSHPSMADERFDGGDFHELACWQLVILIADEPSFGEKSFEILKVPVVATE